MIYVRALGASRIDVESSCLDTTSQRKFALLLYLSAERGRRVSRETLHALIFPDQTALNARHSLRELVYRLRLLGVPLSSDAEGIELPADAVRCDYAELAERDPLDAAQLEGAQGGFLPGYAPNHSEAFAEWYDAFRARSIFDICKRVLREVRRARGAAEWGTTERAARACLGLDPSNEEATLALAEVLAIGGAKAQAIKLLDDYLGDVGSTDASVQEPAAVLKRRIAERLDRATHPTDLVAFVGREDEMRVASECVARVLACERQCLVIGGEPGIGKTRLAAELHATIVLSGVATRRITMQPHDTRRPLAAFTELVPQLLQIRGAIGCSPDSLHLLRRLTEPQRQPTRVGMQPEELVSTSRALVDAIHELVDAIVSETRVALLIDDAHWLDPLSLQTLIDIASTRRPGQLLVVLTTREQRGIIERFATTDQLRVLALKRLTDSSVSELVSSLFRREGKPSREHQRREIVRAAAGNPLFAILLSREAAADASVLAIPRSLIDLLARRLDALAGAEHDVLLMCAALGRHCTPGRLVATLEMPTFELLRSLARLTEAGLIRAENGGLALGHPLIADVLQDSAEPAVLSAANHRAAMTLECEAAETPSAALYWESAECWLAAGNSVRAHTALRECARHALALGRPVEAVATLQKATNLPVPRDRLVQSLEELLIAADLATDPVAVLATAKTLESLGNTQNHDDLEHIAIHAAFSMADVSPDLRDRLIACLRSTSASPEHRVRAATWLIKYADVVGETNLIEFTHRAVEAERLEAVPRLATTEYYLIYFCATKAYDLAMQAARELLNLSESLTPAARLRIQFNSGLAFWFSGAPENAVEVFETARVTAQRIGSQVQTLRFSSALASMYGDLNSHAKCDELLAAARELIGSDSTTRAAFNFFTLDVDCAFVRGDTERALHVLEKMERAGLLATSYMRTNWRNAVELRKRWAQGLLTVDDGVRAREMIARQTPSMTGLNDFETATACDVLDSLGRPNEARNLLATYLDRVRVGRHPLSGTVQATAQRLGIDQSQHNVRWTRSSEANVRSQC